MKIREVEEGDIPYLREWISDPETAVYFPMSEPGEIEEAARLWVEFAIKEKTGLTAVAHGSPVGMGILFVQDYIQLEHQAVHSLVVERNFREMGIGGALLEGIIEMSKKRKVELLHVEVYDDPDIERFYREHGFAEFARQERWTKDDQGCYRSRVLLERFV